MTEAQFDVLAEGLAFPEGPVVLPGGEVGVVEVRAGTVTAVADGRCRTLARPGGGPNGLAWGPDGLLYLCNNGGLGWVQHGEVHRPHGTAPDYDTGRIETLDPVTGEVRRLYDRCGEFPLRGPNDLVFAPDGSPSAGGFWFSDLGKNRARERDFGGVYWAAWDGSRIVEAAYPIPGGANGVGLSPDGSVLYAAETESGRLWAWDVLGPGRLSREPWPSAHGGRLLCQLPHGRRLDSLAVTAAGNVVLGTLVAGELTTVSPDGDVLDVLRFPDVMPTNVCFGGPQMGTAYVTLSMTGRLVRMSWAEPGLVLPFQPSPPS
ncbi:SMP-30/gluconolactonase/LRE family protein [Blastococcus sp. SYSU DS0533]